MRISNRIRVGVIGCGRQAQETHIPNLTSIPEAQLVALSDLNQEVLQKIGRQYNVDKLYPNHLDLLNDDVDAVLISTPTSTHATIARQAANARKHFFVEKPIATTVEDGEQVVKAAESNNVKAMVGFQMRFLPNQVKVKEMVRKGNIGNLLSVEMHSETLQIKPDDGILLDYGIHFIDLMRWHFEGKPIEKVTASCKRNKNTQAAVMTMEFQGGAIGTISLFWVPAYESWERVERYSRFIGDRGKIMTDQSSSVIKLYKPGTILSRMRGYQSIMLPFAIHPNLPISATTYRKELEEFVSAIREDRAPSVSATDGLMALKVIEDTRETVRQEVSMAAAP